MKKTFFIICTLLSAFVAGAKEFESVPLRWKWLNDKQVAFSYDASFKDSTGFVYDVKKNKLTQSVNCPEKFQDFPVRPEGAVNLSYSPDSSMIAFTRNNDLYVVDIATAREQRLTSDGTELILNGYASWVYYEEIFGRASNYKAFWWAPDSKKIAFYRFDNSDVTLFPIYSARGHNGSLNNTRYPKAGQKNPEVRIGIIDLEKFNEGSDENIVWADFNPEDDQYFGTPFWGPDSREFFVSREPRVQNTLDLYSVSVEDGSKKAIYHETYPTWLDWIDGVIFTDSGLYMARSFETGWQQIYFLSYDGKTLRKLTDGENWAIELIALDEKKSELYFTAKRHSTTRRTFYKLSAKGEILALTDPSFNVSRISMSPDFRHFVAAYDNARTPTKIGLFSTVRNLTESVVLADMAGKDFDASKYSLPQEVFITTEDGFRLPGLITYPVNFDSTAVGKYPVHFEVYGGPGTPYVRDSWRMPGADRQWFANNGIIHLTVDPRSAGHNGRKGTDMAYRQLSVYEIQDYVAWAKWISSFPYVKKDKIGVEGFSFGGTTTVNLLCRANEWFRYGIAGGGVYDWRLYDTHYTERFMDTPQNNPEGYANCCTLKYIKDYPVNYGDKDKASMMLKITHGTGDDNVHFQNTLQLIDALQRKGKHFEFMIYPDGMHGYRGYQGQHSRWADQDFWSRYLLD